MRKISLEELENKTKQISWKVVCSGPHVHAGAHAPPPPKIEIRKNGYKIKNQSKTANTGKMVVLAKEK